MYTTREHNCFTGILLRVTRNTESMVCKNYSKNEGYENYYKLRIGGERKPAVSSYFNILRKPTEKTSLYIYYAVLLQTQFTPSDLSRRL